MLENSSTVRALGKMRTTPTAVRYRRHLARWVGVFLKLVKERQPRHTCLTTFWRNSKGMTAWNFNLCCPEYRAVDFPPGTG
jgi:hypothetical protein